MVCIKFKVIRIYFPPALANALIIAAAIKMTYTEEEAVV